MVPGGANDSIAISYDGGGIINTNAFGFMDAALASAMDGNGEAWVGFTAGSGSTAQYEDIVNWTFTVPEPVISRLLAIGIAATVTSRRRSLPGGRR